MTQQPLTSGREHRGGLWSKVLDGDHNVVDAAWKHARDTSQHVGTCRRCAQPLKPGEPYEKGPVRWYPAECSSLTCDYEIAAHGPRPEMPKKGAA